MTTSRPGPLLALGQLRHQLLLLVREPLGFFVTLVVPVLLMVCLNLLTPDTGTAPGVHYGQFLTPAMAAFCLLNVGYVNTVTGLVVAREHGMLKRLRGTPLPAWSYLAGRFGATVVTAGAGLCLIVAIGVVFFDVTIVWRAAGYFLAAAGLGLATFFLLGVAVTTLVPTTETALPVAYGTMLPLAFISDVFFSSAHAPQWLHHLASALPLAPVVRAMEAAFDPAVRAWPMPTSQLLSTLGWAAAAIVLTTVAFRWEPGPAPWRRRSRGAVARRRTRT